ncbi:hypothetical protein PHMEG_0007855 [Phytophthora megakarya]|uniref:Bzip transcription factor n=1 Tax=Phytophthora megakarya TaxID=4795 RepID=A0A225WK66_9STRA|nr:hypothetical protein PHMEG_0007855 [Phytophthora megakarya]
MRSEQSDPEGKFAPLHVVARKRKASEFYDTQPTIACQIATTHNYVASPSAVGGMPPRMANPTAIKPKRKRENTDRRREQCRHNQARYRDRQREFIRDLEERVIYLRDEVDKLAVKRYTLCYGIQTKSNVWNTVVEYFRLFRYGYIVPMSETKPPTSTAPLPYLVDQECFLRASMTSDVMFGELSGVDAFIQQWKRYSTYFGSFHFHLVRMEELPCGVMVASATLSLTITESTLRNVFPHLLTDSSAIGDSGTENFLLCSQLLGQRLDCKCSMRFGWDDLSKRVERLDCTMDILTPLLGVLDNLQHVAHVLEKALITPSNLIGELR